MSKRVDSGSLQRRVRRNCNACEHVLVKGEYITCGLVLAEGDEDDADMADGIHSSFAEMCEDFSPNNELSDASSLQ